MTIAGRCKGLLDSKRNGRDKKTIDIVDIIENKLKNIHLIDQNEMIKDLWNNTIYSRKYKRIRK